MNYYFTASPPQADLRALGIVTKKQAFAHHLIMQAEVNLSPELLVGDPLLVFSLQYLMHEFVSAGGELMIHGAVHLKTHRSLNQPVNMSG